MVVDDTNVDATLVTDDAGEPTQLVENTNARGSAAILLKKPSPVTANDSNDGDTLTRAGVREVTFTSEIAPASKYDDELAQRAHRRNVPPDITALAFIVTKIKEPDPVFVVVTGCTPVNAGEHVVATTNAAASESQPGNRLPVTETT